MVHNSSELMFEIMISQVAWESAIRAMASDTTRVATGLIRRGMERGSARLVSDTLTAYNAQPTGIDLAPLADWIVVAMPGGDPPETPEAWLERCRPSFGQLLVILLVGFGEDRSRWRGWSIERGVVRPLVGFQIVGPAMIRVLSHVAPTSNDPADVSRWSRTIHAVGADAFARLRDASVVVIGTSRTGSLAASMLASLGVNRLGLIDGDTIEAHNLDGMVLANEQDIGANKAIIAARHLATRRSDIVLLASRRAYGSRYDEPVVGDVDLVVTCVDRAAPRLRAAREIARNQLVPHLDIGTGVTRDGAGERQLAADIRLLLPQSGCVRCVGGVGDLADAEYELRAPPGALPRRRPESWDARGRLGSLITLNAMAVATGIQSWLDLLEGRLTGSICHRIRWAGGTWEIRAGNVQAADDCPICRGSPKVEDNNGRVAPQRPVG